jgi:hypothetical protein
LKLIKEVFNEVLDKPREELASQNPVTNDDIVEDFDKTIIGTKTYNKEGFDKKIQMVGFGQARIDHYRPGTKGLMDLLNQVTDVPASVSFYFSENEKIFNVPTKCIGAIFTGNVNSSHICSKRIKKYEERGFKFYEEPF